MNVLTIFNSRRLAVCNYCNCEHYRTKFYFGIWCQNKVIIIIIIIILAREIISKKNFTITESRGTFSDLSSYLTIILLNINIIKRML